MSLHNVLLCQFQNKARRSGVSLKSSGLENIPQVPGIGAEVDQIHDARNVASATFTLKKKEGYISAQKLESER